MFSPPVFSFMAARHSHRRCRSTARPKSFFACEPASQPASQLAKRTHVNLGAKRRPQALPKCMPAKMEALVAKLGDDIEDLDEEVFDLFSQDLPSHDLGMVDGKAETIQLSIAGRDFEVRQSPGVLQSTREGGTTGAAIWQVSVRFAEWMAWSKNPLFEQSVLDSDSVILELGAGISGFLPCVISPKVRKTVVTDQSYVLKVLQENIATNIRRFKSQQKAKSKSVSDDVLSTTNIDVWPLDWEKDDIKGTLSSHGLQHGVDVVLACDCIFNYALIDPLVQTCVDICRLRSNEGDERDGGRQTICVIAQQLRQPEVFEQWLDTFLGYFRAWRIPDELLTSDLKSGSGFVLHIGILKESLGRGS